MHVSRALAMFATISLIGVACSDDNTTGIPAGLEVYTASLNGANEAPTPVTTTATGHAIVTILGNVVTWKVDVDSPKRVWAAGPTGPGITGTVAQGSTTLDAPADSMLAVIRAGRSYVNLHTRAHGGGEIRGTLVRVQ